MKKYSSIFFSENADDRISVEIQGFLLKKCEVTPIFHCRFQHS